MGLPELRVIHLHRVVRIGSPDPVHIAAQLNEALRGALIIETCQRRLWVTTASRLSSVNPESLRNAEVHSGTDAYEFLLRISAGLESAIKGETEIFGQFKCAWQSFEKERGEDFRPLGSLIQKLFEDTKQIRSKYLQGFGGTSYGSLVRKILRGRARGPVLLIGAGKLAEAVLPYLKEFDILLWNRNESRSHDLIQKSRIDWGPRLRVFDPSSESEAWRAAAHAVVCIPACPTGDVQRVSDWKTGEFAGTDNRGLVHLGCTDHDLGAWEGMENFYPLKDLFEIQKNQDRAKSEQIQKAFSACVALANLRAGELSPYSSESRESLALFA